MKDFDELKDAWNKASQLQEPIADNALEESLRKVTTAQNQFKRFFKLEILVSVAIVAVFLAFVILKGGLEPYFIKMIGIILLCSVPVYLRFFLSLKRIMGIDYAGQLKENLLRAKNHLKTSIIIYYVVLAILVALLAIVSWSDDFFLQLDTSWKAGVMIYFILVAVSYAYMVDKYYGSRLRDIEDLLAEK